MEKDKVLVYTVWIGGVETSEEISNIATALDIADDWRRKGYDDVEISSYYRQEQ